MSHHISYHGSNSLTAKPQVVKRNRGKKIQMETNTIDQSLDAAKSSLMSSIGQGNDMSSYKDNSDASSPSSSPADTTLNTPSSDDRSASDASEQVTNQTSSQPEKEGATSDVATNRTDTPNQKPRAPGRIQELLELNKVKEAKIQELEKSLQSTKQVEKPATQEFLIPQPEAPKYTKDVLAKLLAKAKESGDQALFDNVQEQFEAWRQHEMKMIEWKIDHKEALNRHNSNIEFYKQEALKENPDLKDPNSEHTKQYLGIRGWFQKEIPELLKKPVSEFLLAKVSKWKLGDETKSARLVAAEASLKKANEEIEKLKKGSLPLDSKTRTELGANSSPDSSLKDAKDNLMKSLRTAQLGFGAQTM